MIVNQVFFLCYNKLYITNWGDNMVLITGASKGLGKSIAYIFAKNGYDVLIGYFTNKDLAFKLSNDLNNKFHSKSIPLYIDITNETKVKEIFNNYDIDIVINNAAISKDCYIEDKSLDEFMSILKVNIGGTYTVCKYAKNTKLIINISSKDGIDTYNPISLDYSASKSAIINLTKNLSLYYNNTKLYCVCPGWIDVESVKEMNPKYLKEEMLRVGQKELINPDKLALDIYNLKDSNLKSGSVIVIDE